MEYQLSSDSDALICVLYAEYLSRRSHGVPICEACSFASNLSIHDSFVPEWPLEDVRSVLDWLCDHGLVAYLPGDDLCLDVTLTEEAIIYMEQRFTRKRELVLAHLKDLVSLGISVAGIIAH